MTDVGPNVTTLRRCGPRFEHTPGTLSGRELRARTCPRLRDSPPDTVTVAHTILWYVRVARPSRGCMEGPSGGWGYKPALRGGGVAQRVADTCVVKLGFERESTPPVPRRSRIQVSSFLEPARDKRIDLWRRLSHLAEPILTTHSGGRPSFGFRTGLAGCRRQDSASPVCAAKSSYVSGRPPPLALELVFQTTMVALWSAQKSARRACPTC